MSVKNKLYAGIGSRECPLTIEPIIGKIVDKLNKLDFVLRSGGASGADTMFEKYAAKKEIYLPWRGFNNNPSFMYRITTDGLIMAEKYHPAWDKLSEGAKKLMVRNCYQVLGYDLKTPVNFIVCYTKDGKDSGGTGQALRIGMDHKIPIFNLYFENCFEELIKFLKK